MIYTTHLETESRNSYVDQRRMMRGQILAAEGENAKEKVDDKAAWDSNFKRKEPGEKAKLLQNRHDDDDDDVVVFHRKVTSHPDAEVKPVTELRKPAIPSSPIELQSAADPAKSVNDEAADWVNKQVPLPPKELDLDALAVIKSPEDQKIRDLGYDKYAFNLLISDRIGYRRNVRDVRHNL